MKHFITYFSLFTLLSILIGCNSGSDTNLKVGFLNSSSGVARYNTEIAFTKERLQQMGGSLLVADAQNNDANQISQAIELLNKGVRAMCVIAVNNNTAAAIVRECQSRNVPVIAYNRLINNSKPDCFIGGNNTILAELMVNSAIKLKPTGNYYILGGDKFDLNGLQLYQETVRLLKPHVESGRIRVVYQTYTEDWSPEISGHELFQAIQLSGIRPDAILSAYDGISESAIKVMERIYGSVGDCVITGQDSEIRALRNVVAGKQTMTAYHPSKANGYAAAEAAVALIKGDDLKIQSTSTTFNGEIEVPTIKIPSLLVDRSTLDEVIFKNNAATRSEVYN